MSTVYLALGSNIGDREENLRKALALLAGAGIKIKTTSSIYETEPVDYLDQDWFLNAVCEAETNLDPLALLKTLRTLESTLGSKKVFEKGPRLIDLDILLFANQTIETPELQVPHPRMLNRKFVMAPLAEIAPNLRHPSWNATAAEILHKIADRSIVRKTALPS
jgi:2-amino-4-hydroxy-6-hydroxymethyldihydropteridine diphosphokinase